MVCSSTGDVIDFPVIIPSKIPQECLTLSILLVQIRRFSRYVLGEGIEKKTSDFAAEVAAQTGGKA